MQSLNVAVLEPYYGGSHAAFVDAFLTHSRHRCAIVTLPARKWKWRMRGAALWFSREETSWFDFEKNTSSSTVSSAVDVIFCSDMLSVADLRALLPRSMQAVPIVCYFHENQLTYPLPDERDRDYQYGMTNITSCLAADAVCFNSRFHRERFLAAATGLLAKMPDFVPRDITAAIAHKSTVIYPPVEIKPVTSKGRRADAPLTILWCHRWEYDKNPQPFFDALTRLDEEGVAFDLVLLGEQFRDAPSAFTLACRQLQHHIRHVGYVPDRDQYIRLLSECDIVVSTAIQENFGMAVVEAVAMGCVPLLPHRLSYPELIPQAFHKQCLYSSDRDLYQRLGDATRGIDLLTNRQRDELQASMAMRFEARSAVGHLDHSLENVVKNQITLRNG